MLLKPDDLERLLHILDLEKERLQKEVQNRVRESAALRDKQTSLAADIDKQRGVALDELPRGVAANVMNEKYLNLIRIRQEGLQPALAQAALQRHLAQEKQLTALRKHMVISELLSKSRSERAKKRRKRASLLLGDFRSRELR